MTKYPKNCSLRMADGGVISRWAQSIMQPTQARLRAAEAPAPAPVAPPPAPRPTAVPATPDNPAGIKFANGGSFSDPFASFSGVDASITADPGRRDRMMGAANFAQSMAYKPMMAMPAMRNGGDLRTGHGGHVPGSGSGDKIPAKYEPGEFVVSNDMLDQAPGLREQLHGLRGEVLAAKGMTPEEADAKAVSGGRLRANGGFSGISGLEVYERPFTAADSRSFAAQPGPGNPNVGAGGSAQARAFTLSQPGGAGPMPPPNLTPPVPQTALSRAGTAMRTGGGALGNFARSAGAVGLPLAVGAEAANVAMTDTENYAQRMGATAGQSLTGDLAIRAAGGMADVGNALTFGLADRAGNAIAGNGFNRSPSTSAPRTPSQAAPAATSAATPAATPTAYNAVGVDANMPAQDVARGPMPWSTDPEKGFTSAPVAWLHTEPLPAELTADFQTDSPNSTWQQYRELVGLRKRHPALWQSPFDLLDQGAGHLTIGRDDLRIVGNLSSAPIAAPALDGADIVFESTGGAVSVIDGITWVAAEATVIGRIPAHLVAD